jgi:hypothetical protein
MIQVLPQQHGRHSVNEVESNGRPRTVYVNEDQHQLVFQTPSPGTNYATRPFPTRCEEQVRATPIREVIEQSENYQDSVITDGYLEKRSWGYVTQSITAIAREPPVQSVIEARQIIHELEDRSQSPILPRFEEQTKSHVASTQIPEQNGPIEGLEAATATVTHMYEDRGHESEEPKDTGHFSFVSMNECAQVGQPGVISMGCMEVPYGQFECELSDTTQSTETQIHTTGISNNGVWRESPSAGIPPGGDGPVVASILLVSSTSNPTLEVPLATQQVATLVDEDLEDGTLVLAQTCENTSIGKGLNGETHSGRCGLFPHTACADERRAQHSLRNTSQP